MNLLVVHEVSYLRKVVFDYHLLLESMALLGHKVFVLYYESMWDGDDKRWIKRGNSKTLVVSRALPKAHVELVCPNFVKIPIISRASAFIIHYFEIGRVIKEENIDAVILYSVPTNGLQTVHWAKRFNIPVVFRSIDILNQLVPYPVLRPIVKAMEGKVYSEVDRILTLTPKLSEYVINLGAIPEKVKVLPMTVDTSRFCPSQDNQGMRNRWGIKTDSKIVLFMGTLFKFSGLDGFLREFSWRVSANPDIVLMIVGDGEQRKELETLVDYLSIRKNVIFTGFQPYEDMPQYINMSDVCINTFIENDATRDIFPGKTVQYLACGKPLVMRPLVGVRSMIAGESQGVVYADDDDEMARKTIALLENKTKCREVGDHGTKYAKENHSCERIAKQLEHELAEVCEKKSRGN